MTDFLNRFLYYFFCVVVVSAAGTVFSAQENIHVYLLAVMAILTLFGQYKFRLIKISAPLKTDKQSSSFLKTVETVVPSFAKEQYATQFFRFQREKAELRADVDIYAKNIHHIQSLHLYDDLKSAIDDLKPIANKVKASFKTDLLDSAIKDLAGGKVGTLKSVYKHYYGVLHNKDMEASSKSAFHIANLLRIESASQTGALHHENVASAFSFYKKAIAENSANFEARTRYAELLMQTGESENAASELQIALKGLKSAVSERPRLSVLEDAYLTLGTIHLLQEKYGEAEKSFISSLELSEKSHDSDRFNMSLSCLGKTYLISKNYFESGRLLKKVVAFDDEINQLNPPWNQVMVKKQESAWQGVFEAFDSSEEDDILSPQKISELVHTKILNE